MKNVTFLLPPKDLLYRVRSVFEFIRAKSTFLFFPLFRKNEKNELYRFLGRYGLTPYPGKYSLKYRSMNIEPVFDESKQMYYIVHHDKKLYFPKSYDKKHIKKVYRCLQIEQDIDSPHRYIDNYKALKGKTVLDIGAAEGIFSLDTINITKSAYLFECNPVWIEALYATFEPWKEKVTIVPLYVMDKSGDNKVTLDEFIISHDLNDIFVKMDIEGAEYLALTGAKKILERNDVALSVCTYHNPLDAEKVCSYLAQFGFNQSFSKGYLYCRKHMNKAIVRAQKSNN